MGHDRAYGLWLLGGGGILTMGTRSQKKGDKIRELFAAPALHSAQKATDRHPRRGHSPTFVPVPKTQATASHSA